MHTCVRCGLCACGMQCVWAFVVSVFVADGYFRGILFNISLIGDFIFFLQIKALAGSKGQHTQWALSKVSSWAVSARSVQPGMFVLAPLFLDFTHIWL